MIQIFGKENNASGLTILRGIFSESNFYSENLVIHLIKGSVSITNSEVSHHLQEAQMMILERNETTSIKSLSEDSYTIIYQISTQHLNSVIDMTKYHLPTQIIDQSMSTGKKLVTASNEAIQYLRQNDGKVDFHLINLSSELLHQLVKNYFSESSHNRSTNSRVLRAFAYIENNYTEVITLEDIANYFAVSPSYFSRFFKEKTGTNFLEYLTTFRLKKIAKRIISSDEKIASIASEEGFTNINSFNRKFREKYGCSPREYRQATTRKKATSSRDSSHELVKDIPLIDSNSYEEKRVTIKNTSEVKINRYPWKKIMNFGSAEDLLQYDLRTHVKLLKQELSIEYVRIWNLFTKGMNIDPTITTHYNFEKIDSVLDFLIEAGIKPFIELRYKIRRIHRSTKEALIYEKEDFKFRLNSEEWFDLINQFINHVNNRYGKKIVNEWKMEFSFEHYQNRNELDEFISHYKRTYGILKSAAPAIQVGGPGAMAQNVGEYSYKEDLFYFFKQGVSFDFITYLVYPYLVGLGGEKNAERIEREDFLPGIVADINQNVENSPYKGKSIYITEWNITISNRNAINDSLYKGAYIIRNFSAILDKIEGISYWVGSDLFSEFIDSRDILHGGVGLIARGSIVKPSYHAFRFLNFLEKDIVFQTEELVVSQEKEQGLFSLIMNNYKPLNTNYYLKNEDEVHIDDINTFFSDNNQKHFAIKFSLEAQKKYEVKVFRVNDEFGNVMTGWKDIGFRSSLKNKDLEYLRLTASPKIKFYQMMSDEKGILIINTDLAPNEFVYLTIAKVNN
ncbi:MAG: GH39 family glycosyl hydrolase [Enterococcus hulanensis]